MRIFFSKFVSTALHIVLLVIQFVNNILPSIIIHETTNNVVFDYAVLLSNTTFWILLLLQVVYAYVTYLVTKQTHESDKLLKSVIENQEIDLYKHVTELIKQNNFDTAVEVIEIIDKLEERRSK